MILKEGLSLEPETQAFLIMECQKERFEETVRSTFKMILGDALYVPSTNLFTRINYAMQVIILKVNVREVIK